jgi:hypothetical protein
LISTFARSVEESPSRVQRLFPVAQDGRRKLGFRPIRPNALKLFDEMLRVRDGWYVALWVSKFFEAHVKSPSKGFITASLFLMQVTAMFPRLTQKDDAIAS